MIEYDLCCERSIFKFIATWLELLFFFFLVDYRYRRRIVLLFVRNIYNNSALLLETLDFLIFFF